MSRERRNTHGLPRGEPLRRALRLAFRGQRAEVLASLTGRKDDQLGGGTLDRVAFPDFQLGNLAMSERMVPTLSLYWDQSGRALRARLGLDPDDWRVTNPHTRRMIEQSALDFCAATNATTSLSLADALARTRAELATGIVGRGEALPALVKRVNTVFDQAETYRARRIAASEASRAVHAAQEQAAIESEVVAGFEWLLSDDACPLCHKVAEQARRVPLGRAFAVVGDNPTYSTVKFPPLHPGCQCTILDVLKPEYGGPENPEWAETLIQPRADEPEPKPEAKPEPTPKPAVPGEPILPGRPIARRIAKWEGAKPGLAALKAIDNGAAVAADREVRDLVKRIKPYLDRKGRPRRKLTPDQRREFNRLCGLYHAAVARQEGALDTLRGQIAEALRLPDPDAEGLRVATSGGTFGPTGSDTRARFASAADFLTRTCRANGAAVAVVPRLDAADGRAFYRPGDRVLSLLPHSQAHTAAHELMHALEHQDPTIGARSREFLAYRVGREAPASLAELFPAKEYRPDEMGRKDKFDRHLPIEHAYYVGKDYGEHGTEILSMGVEALLKDPAGFAKDDPEYCVFVLGILSGELR